MKKHGVFFLLVWVLYFPGYSQQTYSELTWQALQAMWKAEDTSGYRQALQLYETAFKTYPDSIEYLGLYKSAVLAGELRDLNKAFHYLTDLLEVGEEEPGWPTWIFITGQYAESEYENLVDDPRWKTLRQRALAKEKEFFDRLAAAEKEFFKSKIVPVDKDQTAFVLYDQLRHNHPYIPKEQRDYSIAFPVNDSLTTSYFVHLPGSYDPDKSYPMLIFLHGAIRNNGLADYQTRSVLGDWNRYYTQYADKEEVILVFPKGSREYNWMVPDDGFFMVPEIVRQVKQAIHVDDDRVFISGHSNGATGSFSYLMKQPAQFAGFYGFNTYPKVFTGGTFVENIRNRSFINFSTDQDYYYPPKANDQLTALMKRMGVDYEDYRYNGFPHWFPKFDASEPAYGILYADLINRKRDPFPRQITWEFDDDHYGAIDWIIQAKLDTLRTKASWHQPINFSITEWLEYNDAKDSLITKKVDRLAFDLPRKSGKILAEYDDNVFTIKTSRISSFRINISPEMVDMGKKVQVFVNDQLLFNDLVKYDKEYLLRSFEQNRDREQLWVNFIGIRL
ncbi:MAG: alpha/beta hydrolase-fold protein [Saprospiraceae bacterium]